MGVGGELLQQNLTKSSVKHIRAFPSVREMPQSIDHHEGTSIKRGDCAGGEHLVLRFRRGMGVDIGDGSLAVVEA